MEFSIAASKRAVSAVTTGKILCSFLKKKQFAMSLIARYLWRKRSPPTLKDAKRVKASTLKHAVSKLLINLVIFAY